MAHGVAAVLLVNSLYWIIVATKATDRGERFACWVVADLQAFIGGCLWWM